MGFLSGILKVGFVENMAYEILDTLVRQNISVL